MTEAIVDILYLTFAAVTTYFMFVFLILFQRNRSVLHATPVMSELPSVSIIIPAHNEQDTIAGTLRSLGNLRYPKNKLEIIVVDDGSIDNTYKIAKGFKNVKVLKKANGGKASALNLGVRNARGEIVGCVDSDSHPFPNALLKSVPFFNEGSVGAVTTSIYSTKPKNLLGILQWLEYVTIAWSRKLLEFIDAVYVTPGPLSLYRRNLLVKLGGFDTKNMTEDIEIAWRFLSKGYKVKMASAAKTYTKTPEKFSAWWKQRIRWNIGGMQTMMKYKYVFLRNYGILSHFIWPFFSLSYFLSVLGMGLFAYLIVKYMSNQLSFVVQATMIGVNPLKHWQLWLVPDIFTIFGITVFLLSIAMIKLSLSSAKDGYRPKNLINYLVYLTFYITIFPANLIHSMWRFLTKKFQW